MDPDVASSFRSNLALTHFRRTFKLKKKRSEKSGRLHDDVIDTSLHARAQSCLSNVTHNNKTHAHSIVPRNLQHRAAAEVGNNNTVVVAVSFACCNESSAISSTSIVNIYAAKKRSAPSFDASKYSTSCNQL